MGVHIFDYLVRIPVVWLVVWLGLAALTGALLLLMRSRWGQNRPLRKCALLSLVAHVLLACIATTVQIVTGVSTPPAPPTALVTIVTSDVDQDDVSPLRTTEPAPWETTDPEPVTPSTDVPLRHDELAAAGPAASPTATAQRELVRQIETTGPKTASVEPDAVAPVTEDRQPSALCSAAPIEVPAHERPAAGDSAAVVPGVDRAADPEALSRGRSSGALNKALAQDNHLAPPVEENRGPARDPAAQAGPDRVAPAIASSSPLQPAPPENLLAITQPEGSVTDQAGRADASLDPIDSSGTSGVPAGSVAKQLAAPSRAIYRNRFAADRTRIVEIHGGSEATETAVQAALQWLAQNQSADGRWAPELHEAGTERVVLGHDRLGAGIRADTGITGLALLAYLGAGETHLHGHYRSTIGRGLDYLIRSQAGNGDLGGRASLYARMYCHAMATFAVSEAYAVTGDARLERVSQRAILYSLSAQNPATGGWRYHPGDPGDTSQLGWQAMALKSAALAGIRVPPQTWSGVGRFLAAVAAGTDGGLASYRPRSAPSRTMTAEALACHKLLGTLQPPGAEREATNYLLEELPGEGRPNYYYWYYATLAMYQIQGEPWRRWNEALKTSLVASQRVTGNEAGSWDPNSVWGGYGGRVYSTAMAALSLEVYYRYLPVYAEAARRQGVVR